MDPVGLIAALPEECRPLLQRIYGVEKVRLGTFTTYRFRLGEYDCLLVQSGIGLQRAGEAARALIAAEGLQLLVSFGVAGALKDSLHIGDIVSVHSSTLLEQGIPGQLTSLAALSPSAQAAIAQALQPRHARLVSGAALTTRGSQVVSLQPPDLENPLLEMETAAIAQAAAQSRVPLLALRGISDNPQQPLPIDPAAVTDAEYHLRLGKLIGVLARHPQAIFQIGRLRRNTALAAENTAIAVIAALSQDPVLITSQPVHSPVAGNPRKSPPV